MQSRIGQNESAIRRFFNWSVLCQKPATLRSKRIPVSFAKCFRTTLLQNTSRRLESTVRKISRGSQENILDRTQQKYSQGGLNKEIQLNLCNFSIFIFKSSIYSPNDSKLRKTRARSCFYEIPCYHSFFNISNEKFNLE